MGTAEQMNKEQGNRRTDEQGISNDEGKTQNGIF